jgi:hypothetical protein
MISKFVCMQDAQLGSLEWSRTFTGPISHTLP